MATVGEVIGEDGAEGAGVGTEPEERGDWRPRKRRRRRIALSLASGE